MRSNSGKTLPHSFNNDRNEIRRWDHCQRRRHESVSRNLLNLLQIRQLHNIMLSVNKKSFDICTINLQLYCTFHFAIIASLDKKVVKILALMASSFDGPVDEEWWWRSSLIAFHLCLGSSDQAARSRQTVLGCEIQWSNCSFSCRRSVSDLFHLEFLITSV